MNGNQNLEKISDSLFKEWFINFDFPDENNKPYKTNDGYFKETPLGKIPIDWNIIELGDIAQVKGRIGWRGYRSSDLVEEGPWVIGGKEITSNTVNLNGAKHINRKKYDESPEIKLRRGDIIIAKTGTIGPVAMYYEDYGEATINPNTGIIRSELIDPVFLFTFLKTNRAQYYLKEYTTSSVQPAINQATIKKLKLVLPENKKIMEKMIIILKNINNKQHELIQQINSLTKLRDTLLPKLMSGEIDVSDVEI